MKKVLTGLFALAICAGYSYADKELDRKLRDALVSGKCRYVEDIKKLVDKGANINLVIDFPDKSPTYSKRSMFALAARKVGCEKTASYLASLGAVDVGYVIDFMDEYIPYKNEPTVYETKHLRLTINNITPAGKSGITLENLTDNPIHIYTQETIVDGIKDFTDLRNWEIYKKTGRLVGALDPVGHGIYFQAEDWTKYPKMVNSKIKFTREFRMTYGYDGKTYELKIPKKKEDMDIVYRSLRGGGFLF